MEEFRKLGVKHIDILELSDLEDIDSVLLALVTKIRFRFTNAYFILSEMNNILKMSNNIDPLATVLYSTINYLVDFMLEQTTVTRF
jgi:hypothetical protein